MWLAVAAFGILSYALWGTAHLVLSYLHDFRSGSALPYLSRLALVPPTWILFCPLPWVAWAGTLTFRRDIGTGPVFVFAGTIFLAMVLVFCVVAIASVLTIIPIKSFDL
jgi:hypothetical protein